MNENKKIIQNIINELEFNVELKGEDVCRLLGYQNYIAEKRENNELIDPRIVQLIFKLLKKKQSTEKVYLIPDGLADSVLSHFPKLNVKGRKIIIEELPDFTGGGKSIKNKSIVLYSFDSLLNHVLNHTINNIQTKSNQNYNDQLKEIYLSIKQYVNQYMSKKNQLPYTHYKKAALATYIALSFNMVFTNSRPKNGSHYTNSELYNMSKHTLDQVK